MNFGNTSEGQRGQLVLVAAIALGVALVALGVAYLQLSYEDDTSQPTQNPASQLERALEQAVYNATAETPARYSWDERTSAVEAVTAALADGHAYRIERNVTRAAQWAKSNCPTSPNREFGDCTAIDGVALQDRIGQTHVLALVFDIEITTPDGTTRATVVIERQTS